VCPHPAVLYSCISYWHIRQNNIFHIMSYRNVKGRIETWVIPAWKHSSGPFWIEMCREQPIIF